MIPFSERTCSLDQPTIFIDVADDYKENQETESALSFESESITSTTTPNSRFCIQPHPNSQNKTTKLEPPPLKRHKPTNTPVSDELSELVKAVTGSEKEPFCIYSYS